MTNFKIHEVADTALFCWYHYQNKPQRAYIEVNLHQQDISASYAPLDAFPSDASTGHARRYWLDEILTGSAANMLMRTISPFADRILADHEGEPDGTMFIELGPDARAAENEIQKLCDRYAVDETKRLGVYGVDATTHGDEVRELRITADTTDAELKEMADSREADMAIDEPSGVAVCPGYFDYLVELRDQLTRKNP